MGHENYRTSVERKDWSLHRAGERDEKRHNEKVKEAIKDNLENVISDGSIITQDPKSKKIIKVPMKSLELPRFRYGEPKEGIGTGDGEGQPKAGDPVPGDGQDQPGDQPGTEYYEAEFTIDEIQQMVFDDLGLPNVQPKNNSQTESEEVVFNDIRHKRSQTNLDIGRTLIQNIMRNAQSGGSGRVGGISTEDFRVRTWEEEQKPENGAVVIAMADISGSMGDFEKYVTRAFCWWTVGFLRSKYPKVDIVFVAHDTEAYEVSEEQFFSRGTGGGTKCSAANQKALEIVGSRFSPEDYNVYPLHFSDGDNMYGDNQVSLKAVQQLLDQNISQYAYIQIGSRNSSNLINEYQSNIDDERFKALTIEKKEEVLDALKEVFKPESH